MIYELLSTALLAVSSNSTPKRVMDTNNYGAPYVIALSYDGFSGAREFGARLLYGNEEVSMAWEFNSGTNQYNSSSGNKDIGDGQGSDYVRGEAYYSVSNSVYSFTFYLNFGLDIRDHQTAYSYLTALNGTSGYEGGFSSWNATNKGLDDEFDDGDYYVLTFAYDLSFNGANLNQGDTFYYSLGDYNPIPTYNYTETRNHCSRISGTGYTQLPETFKTTNNPYKIGFSCNDGYYFKTDGSGIVATGGIEILSIDYGNYPTISHLIYSTEATITLNLPLADCSLTLNPVTLSVQEVNDLYGDGFDDAKAIYGENVQFEWIKTTFDGMAGFFNIQILPNISLGFLMFAPIVVVAIVAIVRIIKHE